MKIGVILSTYYGAERLEQALIGYAVQSRRDFELIVADDRARSATQTIVRDAAARFDLAIRHVWQEDRGLRKHRILNQAILSSSADYLIFSHDECIPRDDFVAVHAAAARTGRFLSGGCFKLSAATTRRITAEDIIKGHITDPRWLADDPARRAHQLANVGRRGWRARVLNALTHVRPSWNAHNASLWREDLLRVNGFDERMDYWAQDGEFGERLRNAGVRGLQMRYTAVCVHAHHQPLPRIAETVDHNRRIRRRARRIRATWTDHGVVKGPRVEQPAAAQPRVAPDVNVRTYQPESDAAVPLPSRAPLLF